MAWYAVYNVADGALVSIGQTIASDADLTAKGYGKAGPFTYDPRQPGYQWNPDTLTFDTVPIPRPSISTQAFFDRFTDAELGGIIAARDDPNNADSLTLKGFFERLYTAQSVDLDSQRVIDGLAFLEAKGYIAAGRAAEIRA